MKKFIFILGIISITFGCKKEESTNDFPLDGTTCYLKSFGTSIYATEATNIVVQGGKTFQVILKKATQPNSYYIVTKADETKTFEHTNPSDMLISINTISSPENSNQVFIINKVSNVDAYTIVPQNATTKKLAVDLPPTLTFAHFLIDINSTDTDLESRFILEK